MAIHPSRAFETVMGRVMKKRSKRLDRTFDYKEQKECGLSKTSKVTKIFDEERRDRA
jgi:hypothetical protein